MNLTEIKIKLSEGFSARLPGWPNGVHIQAGEVTTDGIDLFEISSGKFYFPTCQELESDEWEVSGG